MRKQRRIDRVHGASLKDFWKFVNERHAICLRRKAKQPWPWTTDRILQRYKFTNVFRELDRTTAWMRKYVTGPHEEESAGLMIFNCALFRYFGTIETSQEIGWVRRWDWRRAAKIAQDRHRRGEQVFTGAYMITNCGGAGVGVPKTTMVCREYLQPVWEHRTELAAVCESRSLEAFCDALSQFTGWGGGRFMSYEVATDLRHTHVLRDARDINTWANAGPGANRGLARIHKGKIDVEQIRKDPVPLMVRILEDQNRYRGDHVPQLELRDAEHSLCEFDKYCRVKYGEGRPRSRYGEADIHQEGV